MQRTQSLLQRHPPFLTSSPDSPAATLPVRPSRQDLSPSAPSAHPPASQVLPLKRYNPLKIRELVQHRKQEQEMLRFRREAQLPYPNNRKLLSKDIEHKSWKSRLKLANHSYALPLCSHRRTHQFYNCKHKTEPALPRTLTQSHPLARPAPSPCTASLPHHF